MRLTMQAFRVTQAGNVEARRTERPSAGAGSVSVPCCRKFRYRLT